MEARLVVFLAFTSVTFVMNTLLIWFAYKAFANVTTRVTETMVEFETSGRTKAGIASLAAAAQHAVNVTEAAKRRIWEFDPVLGRAQQRYALALSAVDSKLENAADEISTGARRVRDVVAKPAFSFMTAAAGVSNVFSSWEPEDDR